MTETKPQAIAQPATLGQRISTTAAVLIGCYSSWAVYDYILPQGMPTYATINVQYQERLKATQVAINELKRVQDGMPNIQLKSEPSPYAMRLMDKFICPIRSRCSLKESTSRAMDLLLSTSDRDSPVT